MFNLIKISSYYFLFKKFKKQIFLLLFSILLIEIIVNIFNDVVSVLDKNQILIAIAIKWSLIIFIIFINFIIFKKLVKKPSKSNSKPKHNIDKKITKKIKPTPYSEEILKKDKLLTKKDKILNKYLKN